MDNFSRDLVQESVVTDFLIKYFHPYLNNLHINIEIINDLKTQLSGIDIIYTKNNCSVNVDLKAQLNQYLGNPTNTFCLELGYLKENHLKLGWFLRNDLRTDYYAFIWIPEVNLSCQKLLLNTSEDINKLEIMFVSKRKICDYLLGLKLTSTVLYNIQNYIRVNNIQKCFFDIDTKSLKMKDPRPCHAALTLTLSSHLPEKPVNLVISKKIWENLSESYYIVFKNRIVKIK